MENLLLIIRGRSIGDKELEEVRALVQKYWYRSRSEISRQICHLWDWKQSRYSVNGSRTGLCRDLLLTLEKKGLISLPKSKTPGAKGKKNVQSQGYLIDTSVCKGSITEYSSLTFSWIHVGSTSGSAKRGASYHYHGQSKAVFVYPSIALIIRHYLMHKGICTTCGRVHKPVIPKGRTGYGPRFCALVALLSGDHGQSRETVQRFCQQVLGLHLSTGTIQNIINRASKAILPHYRAIRDKAHQSPANNVDETPWYQARGCLHWLWVLCNTQVAFFMVHARRSKEAFKALIDKWEGILISDDYGTYRNWVNLHQTCLAHLLRKAQGLLEHKDPEISKIGAWAKKELLL